MKNEVSAPWLTGIAQASSKTALELPESLILDDNRPQKVTLPPGVGAMPVSSAPQYTLYRMLRHIKPTAVLEIGTQTGASAFAMALAFCDNGIARDITCVDPFVPTGDNDGLATLELWYRNIYGAGLKPGIHLAVSTSEEFLPFLNRSFDFIFVDGSHEHECVLHDCKMSLALLRPGGYFLVHDYVIYESVRRACDKVIRSYDLPFAANLRQRNYRGDLCGWVIARRPFERGGFHKPAALRRRQSWLTKLLRGRA